MGRKPKIKPAVEELPVVETISVVTPRPSFPVYFQKNRNGIRVRKCCASCMFADHDRKFLRICKMGEGIVDGQYLCDRYIMKASFYDFGGGDPGHVRKLEWIQYLSRVRVREYDAGVMPKDAKPLSQIIADYETQHGSRYYTDKEFDDLLRQGLHPEQECETSDTNDCSTLSAGAARMAPA